MIFIKKYTPKIIKKIVSKIWRSQVARTRLEKFLKNNLKPTFFVIGTPQHGNLGDHAIAYAQKVFLKENFKEYNYYEIQFTEVQYCSEILKRSIKNNDILIFMGGGNLGIEYFKEEELRRQIISSFKKQKIIIFPQTIYFGDSEEGKNELIKTQEIYSSHSKLAIIAREEKSFEIMKNTFKNNEIILTPDIVMYLKRSTTLEVRKNILFCFRNDIEQVVSSRFKQDLFNSLSNENTVKVKDTVVDYSINKNKREVELNKMWSSFQQSKLVITDRLHGMIFAAITSTPCIALSNYNQKVKGTYKWIKHLPYIRFIENENDIYVHIDDLLKLNQSEYDQKFAMEYYEEIVKYINN